MKYIVFGADYCPWCLKTKELLKSKKKEFEYYQTHDSDALQKYGSYIPDDYMFIPKENLVSLKLNKTNSIYFLYFWELIILFIAIIYYHVYLKLPVFYSF